MKIFEIMRGRIGKKDYLTINIHNPLWFLSGAIIGVHFGYGIARAWNHVEKVIGG